jgi:hypothetical protein
MLVFARMRKLPLRTSPWNALSDTPSPCTPRFCTQLSGLKRIFPLAFSNLLQLRIFYTEWWGQVTKSIIQAECCTPARAGMRK